MRKEKTSMVTLVIVITLLFGNLGVTIASPEDQNILESFEFENIRIMKNSKIINPKLDHRVSLLIGNADLIEPFENSQIDNFYFKDDKVRLEIILKSESDVNSLIQFDNGVEIESSYENLIQILAPIDVIDKLSEEEYINFIRKPMVFSQHITSEGVGVIGADLVHTQGCYGDGVKVAIIDGGFTGYSSNPDLPPSRIAEVVSFRADGLVEVSEHGTACAEIVLDVAPNADLHLYVIETVTEFCNAVNYAISQGVDVISNSGGFFLQNDLDGTGLICNVVNTARSNDILFVSASGNEAESHYCGWYVDGNGDDLHDFDTGDNLVYLGYIPAGYPIGIYLSWNDWPYSDQDYDLWLIMYNYGYPLVLISDNPQTGSQPPIEHILTYAPQNDDYFIFIVKSSASSSVRFQMYNLYAGLLNDNIHPETSLLCPADASGAMTIGATYWENDNLESFSSRGPTNDGRTKPDVTAPDYVSTWTYGPVGFPGTSASSPHTAGAAALLKSADPSLTADTLQSKLESTALDLGPGGKDNSYGSGRINVWAAFNTIDQPPNADFTYSPQNPTTLDVIQFTDTSTDDGTIVSWDWDFGDDNTSIVQNPAHQYGDDGIYTVSLTVTDDSGKTDDHEDDITVGNTPPTAYIDSISPNPALIGEIVGFVGNGTDHDGTIINWEWNSSIDGFLSNQPSFQTNSLSLGEHTISFRVKDDDDEWSTYVTQSLIINAPPVANFTFEPSDPSTQNIIYFNSTSYDSDGSIVNWTWDLGDSTFAYTERITHQYSDNGTFSVVLLVRDNLGAEDTFSDDVVVSNVPPNAFFTYSPSNPTTLDIIQFLDASTDIDGTIISWLWGFDDGNISVEQNPTHRYVDDGVYSVSLTVTDDDGDTDVFVDDVYVSRMPPEANFTYNPIIPVPYEIIQFTDTSTDPDGTIVSWLWDFGDDNISSEQHPTHSYQDGGSYTVTLNVTDDDGLNDQFSQEIFVNTIPMAMFSYTPENPHTFEDISFNDESSDLYGSIVSWLWDFGDGNTSTEQNPIHSYAEHITYDVLLEVTDEYGLTNNTSQQITVVNRNPTADFEYSPDNPTDIENVTFSDISTDVDGIIVAWLWDFGDDNISTVQNPIHQYSDDGTYTVTLNVTDDDGDTDEIFYQITISNVRPTSNFNCVPGTPGVNEIIHFFDLSTDPDGTIVSWLWNFGDGNTSTEQNPQYMYSSFETYSVALTVTDDDGDTDEISHQIVTKMTYEEVVMPGNSVIDLENETGTSITINATSQTNITIEKYSGNPTHENMTNDITSVNNHVNITVENESSIVWPIEVRLFYSQDDLNNSNIDENQLFGIYFWDDTIEEWTLNNDTGVNTEYNQSGYEGYCWANVWHLTLLAPGGDAEPPTKVTGLTVTDAKDGKLDLTWAEATDNIAVEYYNIYRDGLATPLTTVPHPEVSYQDIGLTDAQSYSYEVSSVDTSGNEGEKSDPSNGIPTVTDGGGGDPGGGSPSGGGGPGGPLANEPPTANASFAEPYRGYVGEEITFDGSLSNDTDGNISSWDWDFGDGTNGTGEIVTHTYSSVGTYTVVLTVIDDDGATDSYETVAIISQPNIPPTTPEKISGPTEGNKNIEYEYTFVSTDDDNDTIKYSVDWDDGTTDESNFLPNGTAFEIAHSWTLPGKYIVTITADDNETITSTEMIVMIDAIDAGDIGYLTDDDGDGIYDIFHDSGLETNLGQENGKYLIDIDGDGEWDYIFDLTEGLVSYQEEGQVKTPGFEIIFVLFALMLCLLCKLYWRKKE